MASVSAQIPCPHVARADLVLAVRAGRRCHACTFDRIVARLRRLDAPLVVDVALALTSGASR